MYSANSAMVEDESLVELMSVAQGLRDDMFLDDSFPRISVFVRFVYSQTCSFTTLRLRIFLYSEGNTVKCRWSANS